MEVERMNSKFHGRRGWLITAVMGVFLVILGLLSACSSEINQATLNGETIFNANCNSCHTIGRGDLAGPDLKGITEQQTRQWLINFISNPDQVITAGDLTAIALLKKYNYIVMPNMGLTHAQIVAVITYIQSTSGAIVKVPLGGTLGAEFIAGNPDNGRAIFLGEIRLKSGAPFCVGCHSIDNAGILGGGTLAPNLTNAYTKYGDLGLDGILSSLPFLTMRPIYSDRSLTVDEKADLRAFMKATAGQTQTNKEPLIIGISLAGFLAAIILMNIVWRNRLQSVRQQLLNRTRARE
jgi:mono/diheme cytochrome c family protein